MYVSIYHTFLYIQREHRCTLGSCEEYKGPSRFWCSCFQFYEIKIYLHSREKQVPFTRTAKIVRCLGNVDCQSLNKYCYGWSFPCNKEFGWNLTTPNLLLRVRERAKHVSKSLHLIVDWIFREYSLVVYRVIQKFSDKFQEVISQDILIWIV